MNITKVIIISTKSGEEILRSYNSDDFEIKIKNYYALLVKAYQAHQKIIENGLSNLYPDISLMPEVREDINFEERINSKTHLAGLRILKLFLFFPTMD